MKEIELKEQIIDVTKDTILVHYNTQDINTAIAMAKTQPPKQTAPYPIISVKCMCEKGARIPLDSGGRVVVKESGTIIRFKKNGNN